jgi:hypothetical protein
LITVWMCVVWPRVHTLKDCNYQMRNLDSCRRWRCMLCPCNVRNKLFIHFWNRTILLCMPFIYGRIWKNTVLITSQYPWLPHSAVIYVTCHKPEAQGTFWDTRKPSSLTGVNAWLALPRTSSYTLQKQIIPQQTSQFIITLAIQWQASYSKIKVQLSLSMPSRYIVE